jgi:serine/threonine protein kinase
MVLQDQLLYFLVCEHVAGEPLRYLLNKQPQLWSKHVGGIISSLATAVASLQNHKQRLLHGSISPDAVLIHFDAKTYEPHIVLCDLGIASPFRDFSAQWYPAVAHPTYTAPELVDTHILPQPNHYFAIDVHGLGLVLYELLVGKPAFPFTLSSDHDIYQAIRNNDRITMTRQSDEQALARIAIAATSQNPGNRIQNATDMLKHLKQEGFKSVEPAPRDRWAKARKIGIIVGIVLAVVVLLILSFVIYEQLAV